MFDRRGVTQFLACCLAVCLGACAAPPRPPVPAAAAPQPAPAATRGTVYEVTESELTVRVYRAGPLAELGHNHVIASTALAGRVELRDPVTDSRLELTLPLDSLVVDERQRRLAAGADFPDNLSDADREGTRRNMLGPALLDAAKFPVLRLAAVAIEGGPGAFRVRARVEVAGVGHEIVVPATLELGARQLVARGEFVLTHADIGLTPFSAALGALRVREDMLVGYRLVARRTGS
jgi:hypothetical protein